MKEEIIVALELSSTAIRGIAGTRRPNGVLEVKALVEEPAVSCMHKGIVDNIEKTTAAITRIIDTLNFQLGAQIKSVYVGLGGQSLHTCMNSIQHKFAEKMQVSAEVMDCLMDNNRGTVYAGSEILEVVPQECCIGNRFIEDPVGVQAEQMEARYLNVIARTTLRENIEKCVKDAGLRLADLLISPVALADTVLRPDEKRSGCALVDMGAETTTVSVYSKNLLRHLVVLPIGGANVTADIAAQKIDQEEAEILKLKYGTAYRTEAPKGEEIKLKVGGQTVQEDDIIDIIEARYEEIVGNIWHQIKPESDKLLSASIIVTGGASRVKNLSESFTLGAKCNKQLRIVKGLPDGVVLHHAVNIPDDGRYYTLLSLLLHGDQNCIKMEDEKEEEPEVHVVIEPEKEEVKVEVEESKPEVEVQPKKPNAWKRFWNTIEEALTTNED